MKHIEIEANGYTFDIAIAEDSPLGSALLALPLSVMHDMLVRSATDLGLSPDNLDEMNAGATQVIYSLA